MDLSSACLVTILLIILDAFDIKNVVQAANPAEPLLNRKTYKKIEIRPALIYPQNVQDILNNPNIDVRVKQSLLAVYYAMSPDWNELQLRHAPENFLADLKRKLQMTPLKHNGQLINDFYRCMVRENYQSEYCVHYLWDLFDTAPKTHTDKKYPKLNDAVLGLKYHINGYDNHHTLYPNYDQTLREPQFHSHKHRMRFNDKNVITKDIVFNPRHMWHDNLKNRFKFNFSHKMLPTPTRNLKDSQSSAVKKSKLKYPFDNNKNKYTYSEKPASEFRVPGSFYTSIESDNPFRETKLLTNNAPQRNDKRYFHHQSPNSGYSQSHLQNLLQNYRSHPIHKSEYSSSQFEPSAPSYQESLPIPYNPKSHYTTYQTNRITSPDSIFIPKKKESRYLPYYTAEPNSHASKYAQLLYLLQNSPHPSHHSFIAKSYSPFIPNHQESSHIPYYKKYQSDIVPRYNQKYSQSPNLIITNDTVDSPALAPHLAVYPLNDLEIPISLSPAYKTKVSKNIYKPNNAELRPSISGKYSKILTSPYDLNNNSKYPQSLETSHIPTEPNVQDRRDSSRYHLLYNNKDPQTKHYNPYNIKTLYTKYLKKQDPSNLKDLSIFDFKSQKPYIYPPHTRYYLNHPQNKYHNLNDIASLHAQYSKKYISDPSVNSFDQKSQYPYTKQQSYNTKYPKKTFNYPNGIQFESSVNYPERIEEYESRGNQASERECREGSTWQTNCHYCQCEREKAACVRQADCYETITNYGKPMTCKPNSMFDLDECNKCVCDAKGVPMCTFMTCGNPKRDALWKLIEKSSGQSFCQSIDDLPRCVVGSKWRGNCHECVCDNNAQPRCIRIPSCELPIYELSGRCKPGTTFFNGCQPCICDAEGQPQCEACVGFTITPRKENSSRRNVKGENRMSKKKDSLK